MDETEFTCGMDVALRVMGGKWKPLILFHLAQKPQRFGELRRLVVGISEKVSFNSCASWCPTALSRVRIFVSYRPRSSIR